jgi:hypothetical protein
MATPCHTPMTGDVLLLLPGLISALAIEARSYPNENPCNNKQLHVQQHFPLIPRVAADRGTTSLAWVVGRGVSKSAVHLPCGRSAREGRPPAGRGMIRNGRLQQILKESPWIPLEIHPCWQTIELGALWFQLFILIQISINKNTKN